jgi:imidazolonepropionase-like amidohydrolase
MEVSMRRVLSALGLSLALAAFVIGQARPPGQAQSLALTHVNAIDVAKGTVLRDQDVIVEDGRITSVQPSGRASIPRGAQTIDVTGKYVIPGLADMHVHWYDDRFLDLFVANGVTTVRQMWGMPFHQGWRTRIERGDLRGPRLSIGSPIVDGPKPMWPGSIAVSDASTAREVVAAIKRDGYDFVKVYERLSPEAYRAITVEARALGMPVAGHVPSSVSALEASDSGQKSVEHLTGILLSSSSAERELRQLGETIRRRELTERFLSTYDEKKAAALFERLVKNSTWQVPTLVVTRALAWLDDPQFTTDARLKYVPRQIRESWIPQNDFRLATRTPEDYVAARMMHQKHVELVGMMKKAGVPILAGTDVANPYTFPGFSLHDELTLLVEAGLTPLEALQSATWHPAIYLGTQKTSGTIDGGKSADMVVLDSNPLEDIKNTRRIAAVVIRGRYIDRPGLDAMLQAAEKTASQISISTTLLKTIESQGVQVAIKQYHDLKARQSDVYDFSEVELNDLGYRLLGAKKIDEAVAILTLNVEAYPESSNVYDSLGEALMLRGDRELAITNYKKSLDLDPSNMNAVQMLRKLEALR